MNPLVYLAGPITGCTYEGAADWREQVKEALKDKPVTALNPLRGKFFLKGEESIGNDYAELLGCSRGIMTRDHWDATRCTVLLVNFLGAQRVSIGTVMEIAWAWENRIPVIVIMEPKGNPHEHAMIREATGFRVETLEQALGVVKSLLNLE